MIKQLILSYPHRNGYDLVRRDRVTPGTATATKAIHYPQVRYVLPRHWVTIWAANWVGRGRGRKSTRPGANGVVELTPFEFLDRLADLVPPPRKHRHRLPT
jgi:hypothetical protein